MKLHQWGKFEFMKFPSHAFLSLKKISSTNGAKNAPGKFCKAAGKFFHAESLGTDNYPSKPTVLSDGTIAASQSST
jgi:hypothetical protein